MLGARCVLLVRFPFLDKSPLASNKIVSNEKSMDLYFCLNKIKGPWLLVATDDFSIRDHQLIYSITITILILNNPLKSNVTSLAVLIFNNPTKWQAGLADYSGYDYWIIINLLLPWCTERFLLMLQFSKSNSFMSI